MENSFQHFSIRIAGIVIKINTLFSETFFMCYPYVCDQQPDFEVSITKQDLIDELSYASEEGKQYRLGYLETVAVYRKISEKLIDYHAFMMHGAAIALNDAAYIFTGKSGTGKTTHIMKWLKNAPETIVINGDKPIIRYMEGSFFVCGTPWSGKEQMNTNTMIPLKKYIFMTRGEKNIITRIDYPQVLPRMLGQIYLSKDVKKAQKTLDLLEHMKKDIQFFDFHSDNLAEDSFQVSYHAIVEEEEPV